METNTQLSKDTKDQIGSVVHDVISQKIYNLVCSMDDNELRDEIRDILFSEEVVIDGVHYQYDNQLGGELPLLYRGSKRLTEELTDYVMKKFIGPKPF